MALNKRQKYTVTHCTQFIAIGIIMTFVGLANILLGLYRLLYQPATQCTGLIQSITLLSLGLVIEGCLLINSYNIIRNFSKSQGDTHHNM